MKEPRDTELEATIRANNHAEEEKINTQAVKPRRKRR